MNHTVGILIPTKNRLPFIVRQLRYYFENDLKHTIYIGDSSHPNHADQLKRSISRFTSKLNIRYYYWPEKNINETIFDLAGYVEEPYCALICDDDFLVPKSITQCAEFLSKHSDFRSAQGRAILITLNSVGAYGELSWSGDYWHTPQVESKSAMARISNFSSNYWVPQFSVRRTNDFLIDMVNYRDIKDQGLGELINSFQIIANGKSKFIDCLYLVRQDHQARYLVQDVNTRRHLKTYQDSVRVFLSTITKAICEQDGLHYDDVFPKMHAFYHDVYLKNSIKNNIWKNWFSRLRQFISRRFVTKNMRKFIHIQRAKKGLLNHYALNDKTHQFYGDYQGILNALNGLE